jgi:anti-sigma factor RsiW
MRDNSHITDRELLLAADGELPATRAEEVRVHLHACWDCRGRMSEIETTIADFARAYRQDANSQLPPLDGPRALLKARLSNLAAQRHAGYQRRFFRFSPALQQFGYVCALLFVVAVLGKFALEHSALWKDKFEANHIAPGVVPDRKLTPGVTRAVAIRDVCSVAHEEVVRDVPVPVRQEILQEYGLQNARANDYEIDYLIAPGLGGADDIQNLWPEPYNSGTWNSRVKDDLEEHLHEMVCAGKLDLSTAQHDISTDWIAAYKKYFHTDRPLSVSSSVIGSKDAPPTLTFTVEDEFQTGSHSLSN